MHPRINCNRKKHSLVVDEQTPIAAATAIATATDTAVGDDDDDDDDRACS